MSGKTLSTKSHQNVEGVGPDAVGDGHRALALLAHDQAGEDFRNGSADGQEGQAHHGVRDLEGVADDGDHPGDDVRDEADPGHAHQERERVQLSEFRVPHVRNGQEEEDVHGHVDEPPDVAENPFSGGPDPGVPRGSAVALVLVAQVDNVVVVVGRLKGGNVIFGAGKRCTECDLNI